jgi:hypothetical protein
MSEPAVSVTAPAVFVQGREVRFPVVVREATSGSATFLVSAPAARRLIPAGLEVAEVLPGRSLLSIAVIDYADNDLGDYHEVSIALFVRPSGTRGVRYLSDWADMLRGRLGTYILHLPVDQGFTCEAGRSIWGFPKTVQQIDIELGEKRATCRLVQDGKLALALSLPRGGSKTMPERDLTTYTLIGGVPHATRFSSACEGFGVRLGGAELRLGEGPLADELRGLGLPRRALMTTWMEHMRGRFDPARAL